MAELEEADIDENQRFYDPSVTEGDSSGGAFDAGEAFETIESVGSLRAEPVQPSSCCGSMAIEPVTITEPSFVYAIGRISPRFPSRSVEKEYDQIAGRTDTASLTDSQTLHAVLSQRENRYLARRLCWVLSVEGLETYILHPADPSDYEMLVEALRPTPRPADVDVVVGQRGQIAPPELCNGLMVPVVTFDQVYSFDIDTLIKSIPRPKSIPAKDFGPAAEEIFGMIMQMADNAGSSDEHRALNYLAVRYPAIYATTAEAFGRSSSLSDIRVMPSRLGSVSAIVDVIFSYTNRMTDVVEQYFVRVDVSDEFPYLVTKMSPYYGR